MAVLAVVAISAFFIILRDGFGRVAAYAFVILSAISPYLLTNLRRAMNEAPLLALLAIAIVATGHALKIARVQGPDAGRKSQWALAILGLVIGLAALTKLNSFGLLAPAMVVAIIAARSQPPARHKALYYASRILLPVGVSLLVFVLFNPFLYKNPPGRIVSMFHTRSVTMDQQVLDYPAQTINGPARRLRVVPMRVFQDHAPLHFAGAIFVNAPLCLIGLVVIGFRAWRRLFRNSGDSMAAALFVTALAMAGPPLFTPLDWQRYHLLPVIFATLFGAIGAGWLVSRAASLVGSRMSAPRQTST
jgi:4-amino-4-deoxy-L-arabinose transferase-like glycosyltransferase